MTGRPLRIGTRASPLALAQAHLVRAALAGADPDLARPGRIEVVPLSTKGDRVQDRTLAEIGGKGLFTEEIEAGLAEGRLDVAVHSMKDMPTRLPDGLVIGAMLAREDPRDALIAKHARTVEDLPEGAVIGTASLRRGAQLLLRRPDLRVVPLRGNVQTRLAKVAAGEADATLLALAGLRRLNMDADLGAPIPVEIMLPAVAQGAVGIECRADDDATLARLAGIDHDATVRRVRAERAMLDVLDGSCRTPIAGLAEVEGDRLRLRGLVATPDGRRFAEAERSGPADDPEGLGRAVGRELLAKAAAFLDALRG